MSCSVGHRWGSDPMWLWLWYRPKATALIQPLAQEPAYAPGAALKRRKKEKKKNWPWWKAFRLFSSLANYMLCYYQILSQVWNPCTGGVKCHLYGGLALFSSAKCISNLAIQTLLAHLPLCLILFLDSTWDHPVFPFHFTIQGVSHRQMTGKPSAPVAFPFCIFTAQGMIWIFLQFSCWCQGGKEHRNISMLQVMVPPARSTAATKEIHFLTLLVGA